MDVSSLHGYIYVYCRICTVCLHNFFCMHVWADVMLRLAVSQQYPPSDSSAASSQEAEPLCVCQPSSPGSYCKTEQTGLHRRRTNVWRRAWLLEDREGRGEGGNEENSCGRWWRVRAEEMYSTGRWGDSGRKKR